MHGRVGKMFQTLESGHRFFFSWMLVGEDTSSIRNSLRNLTLIQG